MSVHIDCDTCLVRGLACSDCVISVLLGPPADLEHPPAADTFAEEEVRALEVLAGSGLVPPLRMVSPPEASGARPASARHATGGGGSPARRVESA